ncbi:MAG: GNAT family N-acetyltransferase [Luteolibacter sp.]
MRILGSNVAIAQVRKNPLHPAGAECLHVRMTDMLVRLYDLPEDAASITPVGEGIQIRRARAYERHHAANFARSFSEKWASEVEVAMSRQPVSCFIATLDQTIVGFACYDTTMRGFFGPTGVAESARGRGIGKCLLMHSLIALREAGYAYAVIGGVGPREFYEKVCGAVVIPGSDPGIYRDLLPS